MRFRVLSAALGLCLLSAGASQAATANANLNVTATVVDSCAVVDATLAYGTVNPTAGVALALTTSINVTCSLGTSFSVGLNDGAHASGGARRLRRGATSDYLTYSLFKDVLLANRFGDTGTTDRVAGLGLGITATPVVVYGTMPGSQNVSAGAYTDTVQITVYY